MKLSRIRQYVDSEGKIGEYIFFPRHFKADFQRVRTISKGFSKCFLIPKGFKAFQSSRNCSKYSKKQIGFGHGNLYNLHLLYKLFVRENLALISTRNRIFLFHIDTTLMVEAGKFGDMLTSKTWLLAQGTQAGRYATKISLLRSLVASQQLLFSRMSWSRLISYNNSNSRCRPIPDYAPLLSVNKQLNRLFTDIQICDIDTLIYQFGVI